MGAPIVGFANGVFDCLHEGHRHFLRECHMNCDILVVAVNGDVSRAIDSANKRRRAVRDYAEYIHQFDTEEELLGIMKRAAPDVIFKGEDYRNKPVTGSDLARIHWVARHPGYSSTIERKKREPIAVEDM